MSIDKGKRRILTMLGSLALSPLFPRTGHGAIPALRGTTMGTSYRIHIAEVPGNIDLPRLKRQIESVLETTESCMSTYRHDSEITRLNLSTDTRWQPLSTDIERVLTAALNVSAHSGGAFSPVVGSLVEHWGFGPKMNHYPDFSAEVPTSIIDAVDHNYLQLSPGKILKVRSDTALDLNAIAKGDAIDQLGLVLNQYGINNYLIEVGGEVLTAGKGPEGTGWNVGVESPLGDVRQGVRLVNKAIATSGDYTDYFIRHGKRYCHLIDPRSGYPVTHGLAAVSVIAERAIDADAWATALLIMGPKDGPAFARDNAMPALFVRRGNNGFPTSMTPQFKKHLI